MKRDVDIKKRAIVPGGNVLGLFTKQKDTSVMEADPRRRGGSCRDEGGRIPAAVPGGPQNDSWEESSPRLMLKEQWKQRSVTISACG